MNLDQAYRHCAEVARGHYENFPVASLLLPRPLRRPVAAIYAFARRADDIADEGDLAPGARLARLDAESAALAGLAEGADDGNDDPVHVALADSVRRYALPRALLEDLLVAFRMDVTKRRYADDSELLNYCRHSANPVGRLLLHLFGAATPHNLELADAVCTGLQLANLWQDLAQDITERDRLYLPRDGMRRHGIDEADVLACRDSPELAALLGERLDWTEQWLIAGGPLGGRLPGRAGLEIRLTVEGGLAVVRALRLRPDSFSRPRIRRSQWPGLLLRSLLPARRWRRHGGVGSTR
jgi:squalene synthase HpnC